MILGAHAILYSKNADADRAFLRDVIGLTHVDAGEGWLIFGLPPSEVGVHPGARNDVHELYLMCDDVEAFVAAMASAGVQCSAVQSMGWGRLTHIRLPGGGKLGVYEPRHARPAPMKARKVAVRGGARTGAKKRASKKARKKTRKTALEKAPKKATGRGKARRSSSRPR